MNLETLNKNIKIKLIKNSAIVGVTAIVFFGAYSYNSATSEKYKNAQDKLVSLKSEIIKKNEDYKKETEALKEYSLISKSVMPTAGGYSEARDRLGVILPKIQEMKDIYSFKKLNLSLSEVKAKDGSGSSKYAMYEDTITLDFEGATDEYVFSFINDLKNSLPGYVNISTMEIKRDKDIDENSVRDFIGKTTGSFISGKMNLSWITMKLRSENDIKDDAAAANGKRPHIIKPKIKAPVR